MPCCNTCRYFISSASIMYGSCHYDPPAVVLIRNAKNSWQDMPEYTGKWPQVRKEDWCGSYCINDAELERALAKSKK